jgi:hypothetical protein
LAVFMALHRVDDEQRLDRVQRGVEFGDLLHQRLVDGQSPGGVDQQHVEIVALGMVERGRGDGQRLVGRRGREPFRAGLLRDGLELLDGRRAVHVGRDGQHLLLALVDQVLGQLGRRRGLARTLQAGHQDHRRRLRGEVDVGHAFAHGGGEFAVDDAHQRLAGRERTHHVGAERLVFHAGDEVAHHRQGDIGLEQGHAHLAQHLLNVALGDARLAAHRLDGATQAFGEGGGHGGARPGSRERESTLCG